MQCLVQDNYEGLMRLRKIDAITPTTVLTGGWTHRRLAIYLFYGGANIGDHLRPGKAAAVPSHGSQTVPVLQEILWVVCKSAKSGGPCGGRTYGPLIKSERKGMTQVVEDLGHPLVIPADCQSCLLTLSVILTLSSLNCLFR